jgi:hypothetical protein
LLGDGLGCLGRTSLCGSRTGISAKAKATIAELREYCHLRPLQELYDFLYQEISPKVALAGI